MYYRPGTKQSFYSKIYSSFRDVDERHPKEVLDLLYRCLNPDPKGRPSIVEFESCEWIAQAPEDIDEDLRKELDALYALHKHPADK
jgi:serine/threonine protein kinase